MSVTNFYNIRLTQRDDFPMENDILSAIRKSYFETFSKIKDKITADSETDSVSYEYSLEKDKPMKWLVKDKRGTVLEDCKPAESERYVISVYQNNALFKRMIFSKLHTLLKVEYFDLQSGEAVSAVEPRRGHSGLCILLKSIHLPESVVLFEVPDIDEEVQKIADSSFTEYYAEATTNEGIVRYMSAVQTAKYMELVSEIESGIAQKKSEKYLSDEDAPLAQRLNVKDFNVKKNLASSIDITMAEEFICEYEEMDDEVIIPEPITPDVQPAAEEAQPVAEEAQPIAEEAQPVAAEEAQSVAAEEVQPVIDQEPEDNIEEASDDLAQKIMGVLAQTETREVKDPHEPDKVIESDDTSFYYYGELDPQGDRSGYGRTVTTSGRTAYEGWYLHDKRSGQGSYYYKDGSLCYTGDWIDNRRSGVGVGVSSADGSIHVGKWVDNRPKGNGARFSSDGNIKFVCKETDDKTVLFNFMPDDSIVIAQYDSKGKKIGEKTVSIEDLMK